MPKKSNLEKYAPVGIAVAVGAAILYFSRRASAAPGQLPPLPPPPDEQPGGGDQPSGGGGGQPSGGGSTSQAPAFPGARPMVEIGYIDGSYTDWLAFLGTAMGNNGTTSVVPTSDDIRDAKSAMGIPQSRSPAAFFADHGLDYAYGFAYGRKIGQGPSWTPWVDAWKRMYNRHRTKPWRG